MRILNRCTNVIPIAKAKHKSTSNLIKDKFTMNLKLNELITSGRALMVEVCPKAGQVARASIAGALVSSSLAAGIIPPSAQASQNYQFRDGISGEIKYAEFCNVANSLRLRVVGEATSRSSRVNSLELKVYSRYGYVKNVHPDFLGRLPLGALSSD